MKRLQIKIHGRDEKKLNEILSLPVIVVLGFAGGVIGG